MFNKDILKNDVKQLKHLKKKRANCAKILKSTYKDLTFKEMSPEKLAQEQETISCLQDEYLDLTREIKLLDEQIYLNYTNTIKLAQLTPSKNFPHISTLTS